MTPEEAIKCTGQAGLGSSKIWSRVKDPAVWHSHWERGGLPEHIKCLSQTRSISGINCRDGKTAPAIYNFLQFLPFHPIFLKNILSSLTTGLLPFASFRMLIRLLVRPQHSLFLWGGSLAYSNMLALLDPGERSEVSGWAEGWERVATARRGEWKVTLAWVLLAAPRVRARIRPVQNLSDSKNLGNWNKDFNAVLKKMQKKSMTHKISKIYFK